MTGSRLLAIDVGNTQITLGLFEGGTLVRQGSIPTQESHTTDGLWGEGLAGSDRVSIASVVPEKTQILADLIEAQHGIHPLIITADVIRSLRIQYDPPSSVGADRLCGAVAAFKKFGGPVVVVDVGTATVFDVISAEAVYLGGLIAPGVRTAIDSLHRKAALLPLVEAVFPPSLIGGDTVSAIQSGVLNGTVEMVNGIIARIEQQAGSRVKVVATGGFAGLLRPHCNRMEFLEPDLVLEGIRLITEEQ